MLTACNPVLLRVAQVTALGLVSVFDQILETMEEAERTAIFNAYVRALGEEPEQYRRDAAALEKAAASLPASAKLSTSGDSEIQVCLLPHVSKVACL